MQLDKGQTRRWLATSLILLLFSTLAPGPASAEDDRHNRHHRGSGSRHEGRREGHHERRYESHYQGRHESRRAPWHFESRHGWRFEPRPGIWSPSYMWWWLDGRVMLRLAPTATIVPYANGHYALRGDGVTVPYYWVWVPAYASQSLPPPSMPPPPEIAELDEFPPAPLPPNYQPGYSPSGDKEAVGTIIGGVVGAAAGSTIRGPGRTAGVIVGTLLGALVGHDIGKSLDDADELRTARVLENNKTGRATTWSNPDRGTEVMVVPQRTYKNRVGQDCREYQTEITVGGEKQQAFGTACRQRDGQWIAVK